MLWKSEFITKTYLDPDLHKAAVWHCFLYIDFFIMQTIRLTFIQQKIHNRPKQEKKPNRFFLL